MEQSLLHAVPDARVLVAALARPAPHPPSPEVEYPLARLLAPPRLPSALDGANGAAPEPRPIAARVTAQPAAVPHPHHRLRYERVDRCGLELVSRREPDQSERLDRHLQLQRLLRVRLQRPAVR